MYCPSGMCPRCPLIEWSESEPLLCPWHPSTQAACKVWGSFFVVGQCETRSVLQQHMRTTTMLHVNTWVPAECNQCSAFSKAAMGTSTYPASKLGCLES
jgi:hypothetical protein